jgi:uncharacterized protein (TIGR03435 family)
MRGLVIGAFFLALACRADDLTRFEVASVRLSPQPQGLPPGAVPAPKVQGGPGTADPGQITYKDIQLSALILRAYGVRYDQVSGPGWPYTQRFDILAKVPAGATAEQLNLMLQNLLLERFNLQLHHESRILPVYELTAAKNGPKLKESAKTEPAEIPKGTRIGAPDDNGFPVLPLGYSGVVGLPSNGHMRMTGQRVAISKMTGLLMLDHPVVDHTGLTGEYDFNLDFAMATSRNDPAAPGADAPDAPPGVFAAVEDQLGLKLEPKKLPFDVLVVDHIDKEPTAN